MKFRIILLASLFAFIGTGFADLVMYTDQATFISQLNTYYNDGWTDLFPDDDITAPRTGNGFGYTPTPSDETFIGAGAGYIGNALSTLSSGTNLLLSAYTGPVDAVGGTFLLTGINGANEDKVNGSLTITLNGTVTTNIVSDTGQANVFVGWIATGSDSVSSLDVSTSAQNDFVTVDNFIIGEAVPEPAVIGLIAIFGGGLLTTKRIFNGGITIIKKRMG